MELTKDADLLIKCVYKEYLKRIKSGTKKEKARFFKENTKYISKKISSFSENDFQGVLSELKRSEFVKIYTSGSFVLLDKGISYMENRTKNKLKDFSNILLKLLPWK